MIEVCFVKPMKGQIKARDYCKKVFRGFGEQAVVVDGLSVV